MSGRHLSWHRMCCYWFICVGLWSNQTDVTICLSGTLINLQCRSADFILSNYVWTFKLSVFTLALSVSVSSSMGKTDEGKWSVSTKMFIFPVQDFLLAACLNPWLCVCVCKFTCISMCTCVCGQSRWNPRHYMASFPVGGGQKGWLQEIGGGGGVWKRCVYPKQTGQIRSEWKR